MGQRRAERFSTGLLLALVVGVLTAMGGILSSCRPTKPAQTQTGPGGASTAIAQQRTSPFSALGLMTAKPSDAAFRFQAGPKPPARVTESIRAEFPPPAKPVARPKYGALKVLRNQPSGHVRTVASMTVTFNQPMVPLTSLDLQRKTPVPFVITPKPPGKVRWLGTMTASYESKSRFPYSTRYEVSIPAGVKSAVGRTLKRATHFWFETPRVKLTGFLPSHTTHALPETPIVLFFNQAVRPNEVLAKTRLIRKQHGDVPLELVPFDEWKHVKIYGKQAKTWDKKRTVVLRPKQNLKLASSYQIRIDQGLGSAEGPLKTPSTLTAHFVTYGAMKAYSVRCWNMRSGRCRPSSRPFVEFTNNIKSSNEELASRILVRPKVVDLTVRAGGNKVYLSGSFEPATAYRVTVLPGVGDIYGQHSARRWVGHVRFTDARAALTFPTYGGRGILEGHGNRRLAVRTINIMRATVTMVAIPAARQAEALSILSHASWRQRRSGVATKLPGRRVRFSYRFNKRKNRLHTSYLNLDRALRHQGGAVYVEVYSPNLKFRRWSNPRRRFMVQVTNLGLAARYDPDRILALATAVDSSRRLPGITLRLYSLQRHKSGIKARTPLWTGKTDQRGVAVVPGPRRLRAKGPLLLVAESEKDHSFVILDGRGQDGYVSGYGSHQVPDYRVEVFLTTDRNPYRAGEKVHLTGVLRRRHLAPDNRLDRIAGALSVSYSIKDPRGEKMATGTAKVDRDGTFHITFTSKPDTRLGPYQFDGRVKGATNVHDGLKLYHSFKILAYRAPEYEVKVTTSPEPKYFGTKTDLHVHGNYLFGAPMGGAKARWTLTRTPSSYRPPKHDTFTFGVAPHRPWAWILRAGTRGGRWGWYLESGWSHGTLVAKGTGRLDDHGALDLSILLDRGKGKKRLPSTGSFTLESQVFDVNRQSIAGRKTIVVHPASLYVGSRWHKSVVKVGKPARLDLVAVTLNGKRLSGVPITVRAMRTIWKRKMVRSGRYWKTNYSPVQIEGGRCQVTSSSTVKTCVLTLTKAGEYEVLAEVSDASGRKTVTSSILYVAGKGYVPWRINNRNHIDLVADRSSYKPGQKATILIKNPYRHATGLLTIEHRGIVSYRVLDISDSSHVETIPITADELPDLHVSVVLVRGRVRAPKGQSSDRSEDLGRPMYATGHVRLAISKASRTIRLAVRPDRTDIRPGQTFHVAVHAADQHHHPVQARLAVFVVDEGVLSLLGFKTPDPKLIFLRDAGRGTALHSLRALLLKKTFPKMRLTFTRERQKSRGVRNSRAAIKTPMAAPLRETTSSFDAGTVDGRFASGSNAERTLDEIGGGKLVFKTRTKFATTAFVDTNVVTDAAGNARVAIPMPENLTAFRIMVVALDRKRPDRFGSGQARIRVNKKLLLRPALPRFANFGDRFEAAVVVNNQTGHAGMATVHIDATGVRFLGAKTQKVHVAAGKAAEVRFAVATTRPGLVRFRFSAFLGRDTDSVQPPALRVNLPATAEATATYGVTVSSIAQPVLAPANVLPQFGAIEVSLSSTALTGLQDAASYLVDYPFQCAEQTASRLVPIFVLGNILAKFHIGKVSDQAKQRALAKAGIKKLLGLQRWNGGFTFWPGSYRPSPYASVYVAWSLTQGIKAGFHVPKNAMRKAARYVQSCMNGRIGWPWNIWWSFRAMAAWVLTDMQTLPDIKKYTRTWPVARSLVAIYRHDKSLALFAKAMLMAAAKRVNSTRSRAMVAPLKHELDNAAIQTASSAHFAEHVTESLRVLLHSSSRTDAIVLAAFMEVAPKDPITTKVVRGLVAARIKGRWETTQANAFAMYALSAYFKKYEKQVPNFVAQLWLGTGYVGSKQFQGRSMAVSETKVPMRVLLDQSKASNGKTSIILAKKGPGRLYYRLGMRYAPTSLRLKAEEQGFAVSRVYEPVDGPKTLHRDRKGLWHVKAGTYVRVRLTVVVPDRRYYTAVVDPLPAGFEIVDMNLKTSASSALAGKAKNKIYDFWSWYALRSPDHKEMRDDAYQLFWDRLPAGVYEYTYLARATTIGTFVVPPLKAEEMYHPETFGRNATQIVVVEP